MTFHASYNFGSVMQAYGLLSYLHAAGYDSEIINFRPVAQIDKYSLLPMRYGAKNFLRTLTTVPWMGERAQSNKKYERFIHDYLTSAPALGHISELGDCRDYDVCLTGADQVWGFHIPEFDESKEDIRPAYYFSFASGKKISYASSTGAATYEQLLPYADLLKKYSHISVREPKSVGLIRQMTGRDAVCCLDPTFLISADDLAHLGEEGHTEERPYALIYTLQGIRNRKYWLELAQEVHNRLGIECIAVSPFYHLSGPHIECRMDAGPLDILALFRGARFVLTDTFHGSLFSIHFRKPFAAFEPNRDDERIRGILTSFDLMSRVAHDVPTASELIEPNLDYSSIEPMIQEKISLSTRYLLDAIEH